MSIQVATEKNRRATAAHEQTSAVPWPCAQSSSAHQRHRGCWSRFCACPVASWRQQLITVQLQHCAAKDKRLHPSSLTRILALQQQKCAISSELGRLVHGTCGCCQIAPRSRPQAVPKRQTDGSAIHIEQQNAGASSSDCFRPRCHTLVRPLGACVLALCQQLVSMARREPHLGCNAPPRSIHTLLCLRGALWRHSACSNAWSKLLLCMRHAVVLTGNPRCTCWTARRKKPPAGTL